MRKAPPKVQQKAALWKAIVESKGLRQAMLIKSFHDEPLKGERKGLRSVCLNIQWRAIYVTRIDENGGETVELVDVVEITPHKY